MSNEKLATVKIENKNAKSGYCIINACDFNEKEHKEFKEKKEPKKSQKAK